MHRINRDKKKEIQAMYNDKKEEYIRRFNEIINANKQKGYKCPAKNILDTTCWKRENTIETIIDSMVHDHMQVKRGGYRSWELKNITELFIWLYHFNYVFNNEDIDIIWKILMQATRYLTSKKNPQFYVFIDCLLKSKRIDNKLWERIKKKKLYLQTIQIFAINGYKIPYSMIEGKIDQYEENKKELSWTIDVLYNIISNVDELNKYIVEYSPDEKIMPPSLINKLGIAVNRETLVVCITKKWNSYMYIVNECIKNNAVIDVSIINNYIDQCEGIYIGTIRSNLRNIVRAFIQGGIDVKQININKILHHLHIQTIEMLYDNGVAISNEQILGLFKKPTEELFVEQYEYSILYGVVKKLGLTPPPYILGDYVYNLNICKELIEVYNFEPTYEILIASIKKNNIEMCDICLGKGLIITDKMLKDIGSDIINSSNTLLRRGYDCLHLLCSYYNGQQHIIINKLFDVYAPNEKCLINTIKSEKYSISFLKYMLMFKINIQTNSFDYIYCVMQKYKIGDRPNNYETIIKLLFDFGLHLSENDILKIAQYGIDPFKIRDWVMNKELYHAMFIGQSIILNKNVEGMSLEKIMLRKMFFDRKGVVAIKNFIKNNNLKLDPYCLEITIKNKMNKHKKLFNANDLGKLSHYGKNRVYDNDILYILSKEALIKDMEYYNSIEFDPIF